MHIGFYQKLYHRASKHIRNIIKDIESYASELTYYDR